MGAWRSARTRRWLGRLLWPSSGRDEGQSAVSVQLEQVVDRALKAVLGAGGGLAAQPEVAGVLNGLHLAEDRLDDRLAPCVERGAGGLGELAGHQLLGSGVLAERLRRRRRRRGGVVFAGRGPSRGPGPR